MWTITRTFQFRKCMFQNQCHILGSVRASAGEATFHRLPLDIVLAVPQNPENARFKINTTF